MIDRDNPYFLECYKKMAKARYGTTKLRPLRIRTAAKERAARAAGFTPIAMKDYRQFLRDVEARAIKEHSAMFRANQEARGIYENYEEEQHGFTG